MESNVNKTILDLETLTKKLHRESKNFAKSMEDGIEKMNKLVEDLSRNTNLPKPTGNTPGKSTYYYPKRVPKFKMINLNNSNIEFAEVMYNNYNSN